MVLNKNITLQYQHSMFHDCHVSQIFNCFGSTNIYGYCSKKEAASHSNLQLTPVCCSPCSRYSWIFHLKWQLVFCTVSAPTLILIYNQNFPSKKKYEEAESFQIWTAEEKKRLCPFSSFLYMKKVCTCFQNCFQVHKLLLFFTLEMWPTAGKRETLSTQRQRVKFNFRKEEY